MAALSYDWNIKQPSQKYIEIDLGLNVSLSEGNVLLLTGSVAFDAFYDISAGKHIRLIETCEWKDAAIWSSRVSARIGNGPQWLSSVWNPPSTGRPLTLDLYLLPGAWRTLFSQQSHCAPLHSRITTVAVVASCCDVPSSHTHTEWAETTPIKFNFNRNTKKNLTKT